MVTKDGWYLCTGGLYNKFHCSYMYAIHQSFITIHKNTRYSVTFVFRDIFHGLSSVCSLLCVHMT